MTTTSNEFQPAPRASRRHGLSAIALMALVLAGGCAHAPSDGSKPTAANTSPWAAPTATVRWNEYAADLIAKNQAGQVGAARTFAYLNLGDAQRDRHREGAGSEAGRCCGRRRGGRLGLCFRKGRGVDPTRDWRRRLRRSVPPPGATSPPASRSVARRRPR